jgi:hypothetical protein
MLDWDNEERMCVISLLCKSLFFQRKEQMKRISFKTITGSWLFVFGLLIGAASTGTALAYQGHMYQAMNALNRADAQLQAAIPDKAGHRVAAINLVQQAISETQAGIAAGAR